MSTQQATNSTATQIDTDATMLEARWGKGLLNGFVVVPRLLLLKQRELGLTSSEVVVLLNLIGSWWKQDDHPYPAVRTLAQRMSISVRTAQRVLESLEDKGFIERVRNARGNGRSRDLKVTRYSLAGAVAKIAGSFSLVTPDLPRPTPSIFNAGQIRVQPNPDILKGP